MVLEAIQQLPILSADSYNLMLLKLDNMEFENSRFEFIKEEIIKTRFTTSNLLSLMDYISVNNMKEVVAKIAYQHLLDKENYSDVLTSFDANTVNRLEQNVKTVNQYL